MKSLTLLFTAVLVLFTSTTQAQSNSKLTKTLNAYMALKNALVGSDGNAAAVLSKDLLQNIEAVNMNELNATTHKQWMSVVEALKEDAEHISATKEIAHQRDHFTTLSNNLIAVFKNANLGTTMYNQFCPMANKGKGANWLSLENKIKNPYYGNKMLSCGKVVETIQ